MFTIKQPTRDYSHIPDGDKEKQVMTDISAPDDSLDQPESDLELF